PTWWCSPYSAWSGMCIDGSADGMSMMGKTRGKSTTVGSRAQLPPDEILFGKSRRMAEVRHKAEKISRSNIPVLLYGDGGTGKESQIGRASCRERVER